MKEDCQLETASAQLPPSSPSLRLATVSHPCSTPISLSFNHLIFGWKSLFFLTHIWANPLLFLFTGHLEIEPSPGSSSPLSFSFSFNIHKIWWSISDPFWSFSFCWSGSKGCHWRQEIVQTSSHSLFVSIPLNLWHNGLVWLPPFHPLPLCEHPVECYCKLPGDSRKAYAFKFLL